MRQRFFTCHCLPLNFAADLCLKAAGSAGGWAVAGRDPRELANSYLIEYCNNADEFGRTAGGPNGFLSQLDSQQLLTYDNLTAPGAYSDMDMLEVCNSGRCQPQADQPMMSPAFFERIADPRVPQWRLLPACLTVPPGVRVLSAHG